MWTRIKYSIMFFIFENIILPLYYLFVDNKIFIDQYIHRYMFRELNYRVLFNREHNLYKLNSDDYLSIFEEYLHCLSNIQKEKYISEDGTIRDDDYTKLSNSVNKILSEYLLCKAICITYGKISVSDHDLPYLICELNDGKRYDKITLYKDTDNKYNYLFRRLEK